MILVLLLITPSIASMQVGGSTAEDVDPDLFLGGQVGSVLEGAIYTHSTGVSGARDHQCAILLNNVVECWGHNQHGELGNGQSYSDPLFSHVTVDFPPNTIVREISAGHFHTCTIVNTGSVMCWGLMGLESDNPPYWSNPSPTQVSLGGRKAVALQSDRGDHWAILDNGELHCIGPCGAGTGFSRISNLGNQFIAIGGGSSSNVDCAMMVNLTILCYGLSSDHQQTPQPTGESWIHPFQGPTWMEGFFLDSTIDFSDFSVAMSVETEVVCWIDLLGWGLPSDSYSTILVCSNHRGKESGPLGQPDVVSISSGPNHSCGLLSNGSVYCWGANDRCQLGCYNVSFGPGGSEEFTALHVPLPDDKKGAAIYSYASGNCVVTTDGLLYCWGEGSWANSNSEEWGHHTSPTLMNLSAPLQLLDRDLDDDGVLNTLDLCSDGESGWVSSNDLDYDHDGCRDSSEDSDDDNDLVPDIMDSCQFSDPGVYRFTYLPPAFQDHYSDLDSDGCFNNEDLDDDNDGVLDGDDIFPDDPSEWLDTDMDGLGDNEDTDNDNDGLTDAYEEMIGSDPYDSDSDDDGFGDSIDAFPMDPTEWADSDGDGHGDNGEAIFHQRAGAGIILIAVLSILVILMKRRTRTNSLSDSKAEKISMEDYVQKMIAMGYPDEYARNYAMQFLDQFESQSDK